MRAITTCGGRERRGEHLHAARKQRCGRSVHLAEVEGAAQPPVEQQVVERLHMAEFRHMAEFGQEERQRDCPSEDEGENVP